MLSSRRIDHRRSSFCCAAGVTGAGRGTRTLTLLPAADFESAASTDSAIPAGKRRIIHACTPRGNIMSLTLDDFDYFLPPERIAQQALPERSASRLLHLAGTQLDDLQFRELPSLIEAGDLLVFNNTRVIHARLLGTKKDTGGRVEVLIERSTGPHEALAQVRASKSPAPGTVLHLEEAFDVEVLGREGEFFLLRFPAHEDLHVLLERHGKLPLPPYIARHADAYDAKRYQTVFARDPGSVAAPTAGLHFDEALLARLRERGAELAYVTLHVGAGTFQPVRVHELDQHHMHRERYLIPPETVVAIQRAKAAGRRVIAVGTTSLRALEGAAQNGPLTAGASETGLFILPGFRFQLVDALLTNFHLPKSTLLMLVSAFAGLEPTRRAYTHAIAAGYRFFSYGDAMFISRRNDEV